MTFTPSYSIPWPQYVAGTYLTPLGHYRVKNESSKTWWGKNGGKARPEVGCVRSDSGAGWMWAARPITAGYVLKSRIRTPARPVPDILESAAASVEAACFSTLR